MSKLHLLIDVKGTMEKKRRILISNDKSIRRYYVDPEWDSFKKEVIDGREKVPEHIASELVAYYRGESVTESIVIYSRHLLCKNKGDGPLPLSIKSTRTLLFIGTDGPRMCKFDVGTLARTFELIDDLYSTFPDLSEVKLPFTTATITCALLVCDGIIYQRVTDDVIECVKFLRPKDSACLLRFDWTSVSDLSPLIQACTELDNEARISLSRWSRFVPDPSLYPYMAIASMRYNGYNVVCRLLKDNHPTALLAYLSLDEGDDIEASKKEKLILELLCDSDLCDRGEILWMDDYQLVSDTVMNYVMNKDTIEQMDKERYLRLLAVCGLSHSLLGNIDDDTPRLFEMDSDTIVRVLTNSKYHLSLTDDEMVEILDDVARYV